MFVSPQKLFANQIDVGARLTSVRAQRGLAERAAAQRRPERKLRAWALTGK
jgi:hypothetical protein